jgi:hypothetical protein
MTPLRFANPSTVVHTRHTNKKTARRRSLWCSSLVSSPGCLRRCDSDKRDHCNNS